VTFDGVPADNVEVVNDYEIDVTSPQRVTDGVVDVVVTTVQGSSGKTDLSKFKYFFPIPVVDKISPPSGTVGDKVTVSGSGFMGVTVVEFGGVPSPKVDPDPNTPDTVLIAEAPFGPWGQVHVTVTTAITSAETDADFFTYQ
jgi:hypothetical protein